MMNKFNEYEKRYNELFEEIFERATKESRDAVMAFVMTGFGSEVILSSLNFLNRSLQPLFHFILSQDSVRNIYEEEGILNRIFWAYLQICENDVLQTMLLNLFFIIASYDVDKILKEWEKMYKKTKHNRYKIRRRRKDLLNQYVKQFGYKEKLELDKVYNLKILPKSGAPIEYEPIDVRNHFAHGAYCFDFSRKVIAFPKARKGTAEDKQELFIESWFYEEKLKEMPFDDFLDSYLKRVFAFYKGFMEVYNKYKEEFRNSYCVIKYEKFNPINKDKYSFMSTDEDKQNGYVKHKGTGSINIIPGENKDWDEKKYLQIMQISLSGNEVSYKMTSVDAGVEKESI